MTNASIFSLGLFGRLSILDAPPDDIESRIAFAKPDRSSTASRHDARAALSKALPVLIRELNSLIEGLILSETFFEFRGFFDENLNVNELLAHHGGHPRGWHYTFVWPEQANELYERALDTLPVRQVHATDQRFVEAEYALRLPEILDCFSPVRDIIVGDMIDFDVANTYIRSDLTHRGSAATELTAWRNLQKFVDRTLGEDWIAYRTSFERSNEWPLQLTTSPGGRGRQSRWDSYSRWQLAFALYLEHHAASSHSSVTISNFAASNHYPELLARIRTTMELRKIVARSYEDMIRRQLDELGIVATDAAMPALLRLCLPGAKTISGVIATAVELRNHPWFTRLRGYLIRLCQIGEDRLRWEAVARSRRT